MEILQTIWTSLITPNEGVMSFIFNDFGFPFIFIELTLYMLLFTSVLNISSTKKQKIIYILSSVFISFISILIFPKMYVNYINMITCPLLVKYIFKTNLFKGILAEIIPVAIIVLIETFISMLFYLILNMNYETIYDMPITRMFIVFFAYVSIYILYRLSKHFDFHIKFIDNITLKNKSVLLINSIIGIITIAMQIYLIIFYNNNLPFFIIIISIITMFAYFFISIYSLIKTSKLEITSRNLEEAQLYNKTLQILHDNISAFKHDFANIIQSLGGYVQTEDLEGLKKYYSQLLSDYQDVNSMSILNPNTINNPAVYSLLTAKYYKANELGIKFNIEIFFYFNKLNIEDYKLTRILGILIDNAIESASECEERQIYLEMFNGFNSSSKSITIKNTYNNKEIDINKINKKGYTTKTDNSKPHGLGLWEVQQIIKKAKNINLITSKNEEYFIQKIELN